MVKALTALLALVLMSCTAPVVANELTELDVLAKNIYFEERTRLAHNTITDRQAAQIGYVVLNRVKSRHYPDTVWGVVYQSKQFSWTHDGKSDIMTHFYASLRAYRIASQVLSGTIPNEVGDADHYINHGRSKARWWKNMQRRGKHGSHTFYKR